MTVCETCRKESPADAAFCSHCGTSLEQRDTRDQRPSGRRPAIRSRVLAFDWKTNTGAISGDDGNRYAFGVADWLTGSTPAIGTAVDLVPHGDVAQEVYVLAGGSRLVAGGVESRRFVAGLLGILLGSLGIHKFYLGVSVRSRLHVDRWNSWVDSRFPRSCRRCHSNCRGGHISDDVRREVR